VSGWNADEQLDLFEPENGLDFGAWMESLPLTPEPAPRSSRRPRRPTLDEDLCESCGRLTAEG
jgi:hypothetical protein